MNIKPITSTFGGYPHSEQEIMSCVDPERTWHLLRENLENQLRYRLRDTMNLRYVSGHDRRRASKYMAKGWQIDAQPHRGTFLSPNRITLSRPKATPEEADFLGWN